MAAAHQVIAALDAMWPRVNARIPAIDRPSVYDKVEDLYKAIAREIIANPRTADETAELQPLPTLEGLETGLTVRAGPADRRRLFGDAGRLLPAGGQAAP